MGHFLATTNFEIEVLSHGTQKINVCYLVCAKREGVKMSKKLSTWVMDDPYLFCFAWKGVENQEESWKGRRGFK